jgi:hypothetical protein
MYKSGHHSNNGMPWPRFPLFVVVSPSRPQMRRIYGMDLTFTARNVIFILLNKNFYYNQASSLASLQIPQMVGQSIHQFCRFTSTGMHNRGVPRLPQMYNVVLPTIRVAAVGFH